MCTIVVKELCIALGADKVLPIHVPCRKQSSVTRAEGSLLQLLQQKRHVLASQLLAVAILHMSCSGGCPGSAIIFLILQKVPSKERLTLHTVPLQAHMT
jgi:hypothetical protein